MEASPAQLKGGSKMKYGYARVSTNDQKSSTMRFCWLAVIEFSRTREFLVRLLHEPRWMICLVRSVQRIKLWSGSSTGLVAHYTI